MISVKWDFSTSAQVREFVQTCENRFEESLSRLVRSIVHENPPRVITLAGPSCSGKTTIAGKLTAEITAAGKKAVVLSIDDFFYDRPRTARLDVHADYDSVAAIDLSCLSDCTDRMMRAESVRLPQYDFVTGRRSSYREYVRGENDIIIYEGIQAVYPEVTALLRSYPYKSIFVDVTDDITADGILFDRTEVRLARRIVRDFRFRSAPPEFTLALWESVRRNEEDSIFPYAGGSDYVLNSLQPYELYLIGQYVLPLLETVDCASPQYHAAAQLAAKFRALRGESIDPECLSPNALYHEFLG